MHVPNNKNILKSKDACIAYSVATSNAIARRDIFTKVDGSLPSDSTIVCTREKRLKYDAYY